ncbi:hypothetical protein JG688_00013712, partial [Phytophthora aleatoria]
TSPVPKLNKYALPQSSTLSELFSKEETRNPPLCTTTSPIARHAERSSASKKITLREVHTIVQRLQKERLTAGTVEARLETVLRKFCCSLGNAATVFVDDKMTMQRVTVPSQQLRRFWRHF